MQDDFVQPFEKVGMKGKQCGTLLDSLMYKGYHNVFFSSTRNLDLCPLMASSRNLDDYVAKELNSILSARHSESASGSRSDELTSSASLHSINLELIRLETFKSFKGWKTISTIKLAKEGFYYSGHDDQVTCFSCGFEKSGWRVNDDPREVHRQQSPNCSFILGFSDNVRVGESMNSPDLEHGVQIAQQTATDLNSTGNGTQSQGNERASSFENLPSCLTVERDNITIPPVKNFEIPSLQRLVPSEPQKTQETKYDENSTNYQQGQSIQGPENVVQITQQSASNLNSSENRTQSQGTEEATSDENLPSTPEQDHIALPPVRNVETIETTPVQRDPVSDPHITKETRYEENSTNQQQVQSSAINYSAKNNQEKINAFLRNLDPLGINFDRPKYPAYAVLATRVSSYQGSPASLTQQPRDLVKAGFFYVGYGDYTRCFFCGGGLRNWAPGEDPWTEHARWFPKCAFVRQNKGDEFVALVQIKHQELVSIKIYVNILLFY